MCHSPAVAISKELPTNIALLVLRAVVGVNMALLHGWDKSDEVTAFIGRKVMDDWVAGDGGGARRPSLFRDQYNALGKQNLAAIDRVVRTKYDRGASFNRQHPFVEVLLADIVESGEALDTSLLVARGGGLAPPRML